MKTSFLTVALSCFLFYNGYSQCPPFPIPFVENFNQVTPPDFPNCMYSQLDTFIGNNWRTAAMPIGDTPNNVVQYPTFSTEVEGMNATLMVGQLALQAGIQYKLTFKYGVTAATTGISSLAAELTPWGSGGAGKIIVTTLTDITLKEAVFTSEPIVPDQTSLYTFSFIINTPNNQGNFYIDDIVLEEWGCSPPTGLSVADISDTGALLSWTGNSAPNYEYIILPAGQNPEFGISNGTSNAIIVSNLQSGRAYTAYIRGYCMDSWSTWSTGVNFTTTGVLALDDHEINDLILYPNPVKDVVTLSSVELIESVGIHNAIGQLVYSASFNSNEVNLSLQNLSSGTYLLVVSSGNKTKKMKILRD